MKLICKLRIPFAITPICNEFAPNLNKIRPETVKKTYKTINKMLIIYFLTHVPFFLKWQLPVQAFLSFHSVETQ